MTENAQDYVPAGIGKQFRSQAFRAWTVTLIAVFAWVLAIILAPVAKFEGFNAVASPLYHFYGYICHQIPERSFFIDGEPFGVCSRCFGVYFGLLAGVAVYPLWRHIDGLEPPPRFWLFLSLIPMGVDWSLTFFGIWENTLASRFITGLILGAACATYIVPAIVEITRNLTHQRRDL